MEYLEGTIATFHSPTKKYVYDFFKKDILHWFFF